MKILAVSDIRLPQLGSKQFLHEQYSDVKALISCGDLDPDYLDYITAILDLPLFFVRGNHDNRHEASDVGGVDLHRKIIKFSGFSMAGLEGSIRYNNTGVQYYESTMSHYVFSMLPRLLMRRLRYGYGVDVFVAHSPPLNIHDAKDYAHRGFRSFRWLIRWGKPRYFIHGHVDVFDRRILRETQFYRTKVININPSMVLDLGQ